MYIALYKSVSSPEELYSERRDTLDFPTQIEFNKKRYLLNNTFHANTESVYKNIVNQAQKNNSPYDIKL
jgi:hypothetical protein